MTRLMFVALILTLALALAPIAPICYLADLVEGR